MAIATYIVNTRGTTISVSDAYGNPINITSSALVSLTDSQYQEFVALLGASNVTLASAQQQPTNTGSVVSTAAGTSLRVSLTDPTSGASALVQAFHNTDNQVLSGTVYGVNTGGVAQFINVLGNLDRQRATGADNLPATGIAAGAASFAMFFKTTIASAIVAGTRTITPAMMTSTIGNVTWSIQANMPLIIDTGASQEIVFVTAVTGTTFTATFANNHASTPVKVTGFVFNQERDASGEVDGASGSGTAVAAEYEYNGGDPSGGNFDRGRNVNGKGYKTQTINSGGGVGSSSLTLAANAGLQPGTKILLYKAANFPSAGYYESVNVDLSYVPGSNTVPLASAIVNSVTYDTVAYDTFAPLGPQMTGFTSFGIGIETDAVYDPYTGKYFGIRMAPGNTGALLVSTDSAKATYRYCYASFSPVATPTDALVIQGSATATVRVKRIKITGQATAQGSMPVQLIRRLSTGGTVGSAVLTAITAGKHDVNDAAATAVVSTVGTANYTTVQTANGVIAVDRLGMSPLATGAAGQAQAVVWDFANRNDKALILRGANDYVMINFAGAAVPSGGVIDFEIETEEDAS